MKKIALVYDWLTSFGGAERVIEAILKIWPQAELFASVYNEASKNFTNVQTTFVQKLPLSKLKPFIYYPILPIAFEQFNFDNFDLVISISSGPAKAIITKPETFHLNYCLTPPRYLWQKKFLPFPLKYFFPFLFPLRIQDYILARRPDVIFTISKTSQKRIKKFYNLASEVIYPGVDLEQFRPAKTTSNKQKPYFLLVSRLVEYKNVDLAIKSFNMIGLRLKIIGTGRQINYLKKIAGKTIEFLGQVDDQRLVEEYQNCQALICPQEEDFGLTSIEVQACGKPVISFALGGAQETIISGKTGEFFYPQTPAALAETLLKFNPNKYKIQDCLANAKNFDLKKFMVLFKNKTEARWQQYKKKLR